MNPEEIWPSILAQIRESLPTVQYQTWFTPLAAGPVAPDHILLRVPNQYFKEWLNREYRPLIEECAEQVVGRRPRVEFALDPTLLSAPETATEPDPRLNQDFTFDNFVVGPSNQLACAAAVDVAANPGERWNPLYIHGSVGLGKSHLLQAICHKLHGDGRAGPVMYTSCESFVNDFISAIQRGKLETFRRTCRRAGALVIDDVQFLSRAERSQEEFFHTFNTLHNARKQIVLSSDSEPADEAARTVRTQGMPALVEQRSL